MISVFFFFFDAPETPSPVSLELNFTTKLAVFTSFSSSGSNSNFHPGDSIKSKAFKGKDSTYT